MPRPNDGTVQPPGPFGRAALRLPIGSVRPLVTAAQFIRHPEPWEPERVKELWGLVA